MRRPPIAELFLLGATTIVVDHGLVHPLPWCGQRFSAMGQRVKARKNSVKTNKQMRNLWEVLI